MGTTLAERLRERMTAPEVMVTAAELARRAGVKPPSVFLWLDGTTKNIKYATLLRVAAALKTTPEWLATGIGRKLPTDDMPAPAANEPGAHYGRDATIAEAVKLLEAMSSSARVEALSFLRVFAAKKGAHQAHGADTTLPAAAKHAA